ncbi:hypothetical protein HK100_008916 [Physocladia obscura]|uniref:Uncharacterized protein n=1 Tax=Physocladia obscura TaxID=109957 RepID=A0AAD5T4S6_9FUNG|nr:hypothetical protein HK100_008916 [Physocladia obscura]
MMTKGDDTTQATTVQLSDEDVAMVDRADEAKAKEEEKQAQEEEKQAREEEAARGEPNTQNSDKKNRGGGSSTNNNNGTTAHSRIKPVNSVEASTSASKKIDRLKTPPFLIRVNVRSVSTPLDLSTFKAESYIHAWKDITLREIALLLSQSHAELNDPDAKIFFKLIYSHIPTTPKSGTENDRRRGSSNNKRNEPNDSNNNSNSSRRRSPAPKLSSDTSAAAPTATIAQPLKSKDLGQILNFGSRIRANPDETKTLEESRLFVGDMLDVSISKGFSIVGASASGVAAPTAGSIEKGAAARVDVDGSGTSFRPSIESRLGGKRSGGSFNESNSFRPNSSSERRDGERKNDRGSRFNPYGVKERDAFGGGSRSAGGGKNNTYRADDFNGARRSTGGQGRW